MDTVKTVIRRALNYHILVYKQKFSGNEVVVEMNPDLERLPLTFSMKRLLYSKNTIDVDEAAPATFSRHLLVEDDTIFEVLSIITDEDVVAWKIIVPFEMSHAFMDDLDGVVDELFEVHLSEWEPIWMDFSDRHLAIPLGEYARKRIEVEQAQVGEAQYVVKLDEGVLEFGVQDKDTHEYFLQGERFTGRVLIQSPRVEIDLTEAAKDRLPSEAEQWLFFVPKQQTPLILTTDDPPALTRSYLPESLRKQIPPKLRYWKENSQVLWRKAKETVDPITRTKDQRMVEF